MSYLFAAYTVTWILLFLYVLGIASKQKKLDSELDTLKKLIEQKK
jgi:CcmD family protein